MLILLIFAFISGLVTIFAPCIWPLLPIILSATTSGGHRKPLGITLGIITSFAFFTLTLSYIVKVIPLDPDALRLVAVLVIGALGLSLVIPKLSQILEGFVSRLSGRFAPTSPNQQSNGFWSGYLTGAALGLVWSPCAGPILATIATLAATQAVNWQIILVTLTYVAGVGIPLFIFATAGQTLFTKARFLSAYTGRIQQIFGIIMILTAFAIFTGYDRLLQSKLLDAVPAYSTFLFDLEGNEGVKKQLNKLINFDDSNMKKNTPFTPMDTVDDGSLQNYGQAPEISGIYKWLNLPTDKYNSNSLTIAELKGQVILVDFWTYTCINCIRSLPYVTSWYEKYKEQGLIVLGIHTPEFEFEKDTDNVANAIKQYNINYPVAQDNDYLTWRAFNNRYWPAKYLIDSNGNIRYYHFGEGKYKETEKAIQSLLAESGEKSVAPLEELTDQTPKSQITPETYLGLSRRERYSTSPTLSENQWSLEGDWDTQNEYILSKNNSSLDFKFRAAKVFLVITPESSSDIIKVSLDGKDVNTITASEAKLYQLIDLPVPGSHLLHLDFETSGTKAYAFTFGD